MYPAGNLFLPVAHGQLECMLKEPRQDGEHPAALRGAALILHPHPLHGGTMHNKVVFRLARSLNNARYVALRVNFRGVGASTGTHDYARGEQDDARAGLDYLAEHYPGLPLLLAGFSFGSRVGLEVGVSDERIQRLIALGTPLKLYDFSFLRECRKPILFVHGSLDEFGEPDDLRRLAAELPPEAQAQVEIISGAGHFFDDKLPEMERIVTAWASGKEEAKG